MQNSIIKNILNKISQKYPKIDTILLFGSALDPGWTKKSDIDLYFIDNNINDGRIDLGIDSVKVEIQTDNFNELKTYIEDESGKLLNRNVSTMLANSEILKTESKEQIENLITLAKKTLKTPVDYTTEDVKMWIYSVNDYLEKSIKDVERGNIAAFYFDAHFVIQNATELILATNNHYFPQPKNLTHILEIISPEFLKNIEGYELATSLNDKLLSLQKIAKLCNLK
ncbi:nucleotidyltransferase domain-containing protein [TM7 phylum sp. oral taxon 351]|nr:nucleotidyltransferase domain-containing protein [TM7 phylum sp. oral taxon 351]